MKIIIINKIKAYSNRFYSYKDISAGNVEIFEAGDLRITKISAIPFIDRRYEKGYLPFPILIASKYRKADYKQKPLLDRGILVATIGDIEIPNPSDMLINYRGGALRHLILFHSRKNSRDISIYVPR